MLTNCFRFAPRDSVPGLIAKICKYLKDHPGWSEEELKEQIKHFIEQTGVESFNGRTGAVVLNEDDVNNLKIESAYFAEGDETIDELDLVALYNQGVRFVFTNWNSVTSGYDLSFVLDYFGDSNDVVYYPMATGSVGGNIVSVNGKTGIVELSLSDILGDSGAQVKLCTATEFTSNTIATWNAYYEDGYRIVGVVNYDASAIDYIYLLRQDENNHQPVGISYDASDAYTPTNPPPYPVTSVNGDTGEVFTLRVDPSDPGVPTDTPAPINATTLNGKDAGYYATAESVNQLSEKIDDKVDELKETLANDISWLDGYDIPVLTLIGDTTGMSKDVAKTLTFSCKDKDGVMHTGTCTLKWQGASSIAYDKKNFTIKLEEPITMVEKWGAQKKYCLKANWIDHSHARNVVSAKLWGTLVSSRNHVHPSMAASPNYGAVDGFPYAIILNGKFQGLYTWNIPKEAWMAGMGSGAQEAILCASGNNTDIGGFKALPNYTSSDIEIEYAPDEDNVEWIKTSANRLISAVMASYGADLDTTIAQYLDWESAIDYYLFTAFHGGQDNVVKNYLLLTYDGVKWYFGAYDMDGTYGIAWNGKIFDRANSTTAMTLDTMAGYHRVFELIKRFKPDALKARWARLRADFLSEGKVVRTFENFVKDIPSRLYAEDVRMWPGVPSTSVSNIDQILRWVHLRLQYVDEMVENLTAAETPVAPEPAMVNQVPISTDTDGSIYNGTGYKDNTRLSSSGGVSGTPQDGSVTVGFIPAKWNDVIRVKGGTWLGTDGHYYFHLYDANKTKLYGVDRASHDNGGLPGMSVTYDGTTGVTTFDCSAAYGEWASEIKSTAYIRLNVYGKGSGLIITVNQEITE